MGLRWGRMGMGRRRVEGLVYLLTVGVLEAHGVLRDYGFGNYDSFSVFVLFDLLLPVSCDLSCESISSILIRFASHSLCSLRNASFNSAYPLCSLHLSQTSLNTLLASSFSS